MVARKGVEPFNTRGLRDTYE